VRGEEDEEEPERLVPLVLVVLHGAEGSMGALQGGHDSIFYTSFKLGSGARYAFSSILCPRIVLFSTSVRHDNKSLFYNKTKNNKICRPNTFLETYRTA
jgi:hypothetical protein